MVSLTKEEHNFLRMYKLVSGIAPKAVRSKFDVYFPPSTLDSTVKREKPKIQYLHTKKRITAAQMIILFPVNGTTSSVNYDTTLMICLLRNLSTLPPPLNGYDVLPPSAEISDGADLARVKNYRNKFSHSVKDTITTTEFGVIWKDLSEALIRLGGMSYKKMCVDLCHADLDNDEAMNLREEIQKLRAETDLKVTILYTRTDEIENQMTEVKQKADETSKRTEEIENQMTEVKQTADHTSKKTEEIETKMVEVKQTTENTSKKTESLTVQLTNMARTTDYVSTQLAEMKLCDENCSCYDFHQEEIEEWEQKNEHFVKTDAVEYAFDIIETSHKITVTGIPGTGKSALIQHIALSLRDNQGCSIIPCSSPSDIREHYKKGKCQVFVINDVCGRYVLNQYDLDTWKKHDKSLSKILQKGNIKILTSSRLQVFQEIDFQNFNLLSENVCDLSSDRFKLSKPHKKEIALKYMSNEIVLSIQEDLEQCECIPLMCSLYKPDCNVNPRDFFQNPAIIYYEELDQMLKESNKSKICALFLFIVYNGCITEDCLRKESREKLETVFEVFRINRGTCLSEIIDQLDSMSNTYLTISDKKFKIVHDKIFDIICFYFGRKLQQKVIRFAHCKIIYERTLLETDKNVTNEHEIKIEKENEDLYFQRILDDISAGNVIEVFYSSQMSRKHFRSQFIKIMDKQDRDYIKTILTSRDAVQKGGVDSAFHIACSLGYCDIIEFIFTIINDVNIFPSDEFPPLHQACLNGHKAIVQKFIEKGADINREGYNGLTPLIWACTGGCNDIVLLLLENGANVNKEVYGRSAVSEALSTDNSVIFDLLLSCTEDANFENFLMQACESGSIGIVNFLIQKGVDVNVSDDSGWTALMESCLTENMDLINCLISVGAVINRSDVDGKVLLVIACERGNVRIAQLLISNGADINQKDIDGISPLTLACASFGYY